MELARGSRGYQHGAGVVQPWVPAWHSTAVVQPWVPAWGWRGAGAPDALLCRGVAGDFPGWRKREALPSRGEAPALAAAFKCLKASSPSAAVAAAVALPGIAQNQTFCLKKKPQQHPRRVSRLRSHAAPPQKGDHSDGTVPSAGAAALPVPCRDLRPSHAAPAGTGEVGAEPSPGPCRRDADGKRNASCNCRHK